MVDQQTAEARTAMPERRNVTLDIVLMILAWFTISPLIMLINKNERYFKNWVMWLIILGSPLVGNLLVALLIPMFGMICLAEYVGYVFSLGDINSTLNLSAYPELTQFSNNLAILFLELMCLPIYAACVAVLYVTMQFTGWSYRTASVYICEYAAPLFCAACAVGILIIMTSKYSRMSGTGRWLMVLPAFAEAYMAYDGIQTYLVRKALYAGMTNDAIFKYVVDYLMKMGESSHTNYVLANMYVYILPFLLILIVGLIGWMIYRFT
ncbi:MAG: hypothetical protein HDR87_07115, partial [Bacteroides sp.]|nr:hypothetical protein [Bacteroides sp.]